MMRCARQKTVGIGMFVLLRHGESELNAEGRFSGWADCRLTAAGMRQAHEAGRKLRGLGIGFDVCFTSVLSRAVVTAEIVLGEMDLADIPVTKTWRLNERHYGILEGVSKLEAEARYGAAQVGAWRNAPDAVPPPLDDGDIRHPRFKSIYSDVAPEMLPASECLNVAFRRVVDFFESKIRPVVMAGGRVLVVTHGNPMRAIVAHLNGVPSGEIPILQIRNADPIVYTRDHSGELAKVLVDAN